jgi:hypothetical protein
MNAMDYELIGIIVALLGVALAIIRGLYKIGKNVGDVTTTIDIHGNAIGEHKRRLDAHEELHKEHIRKIANLEGQHWPRSGHEDG